MLNVGDKVNERLRLFLHRGSMDKIGRQVQAMEEVSPLRRLRRPSNSRRRSSHRL